MVHHKDRNLHKHNIAHMNLQRRLKNSEEEQRKEIANDIHLKSHIMGLQGKAAMRSRSEFERNLNNRQMLAMKVNKLTC